MNVRRWLEGPLYVDLLDLNYSWHCRFVSLGKHKESALFMQNFAQTYIFATPLDC